jgi:enoyl-CoA hydratase/carnithine racemase
MNYREKKYDTVLLSIEDNVAIIQFNRPEAMNALNRQMGEERN